MRNSQFLQLGALALLTLASAAVRAEDIDIYQGSSGGSIPNMLIILDNAAAASASSSFTCPSLTVNDPNKNLGFEQCGLHSAVSKIGSNAALNGNINLGLMYFPGGPTDGGTFVLPAASPAPGSLLLMDGTSSDDSKGVGKMLRRVEALSLNKDKGNNNQIAQAMQEAWAFYQGKTGLSGTTYPGLANQQACGKNFVLYITLATNNQKPQDSGTRGGTALQAAAGLSALPAQLTLPAWKSELSSSAASGKYRSDYADEWANFMYTGSSPNLATTYPGITTYTIILSDGSNPDYEQLMVSMAEQGGGKYFLVELGDVQGLIDAILQIFNEVQAVNSVFAAPVLPVSANTQGTYLNQIYMGMFRPDGDVNPRWQGNLKQYQFGVDITDPTAPQLFLADASWGKYSVGTNANRALSAAGTGFISPSAVSFWTSKSIGSLPDSKGGFWLNAFKEQGAKDGYDWEDGQVVEKGGVGQQIRLKYLTDSYSATAAAATPTTARNVFTCIGTGCSANAALSTMPFKADNTNLSATALGIIDSKVTPANLINWVRGEDTYAAGDTAAGRESSSPPDASIKIRGSVHGDVLHSRPAVINYGGTTGVVVFYGANDGMFRAINGNQPNNPTDSSKPMGNCTVSSTCALTMRDATGATTSIPPGGELWSFVPSEFYPGLQRLYENSPTLKLGTLTTGSAKNYFFDGAPSVYQNSATGKAYIFLSARRGGRLLYALDVSDPTNPKFMWKRTNADTGFAELGQTWSQPKVAMIKGHANPVLIFGAGYDTNEDVEPPNADTMGRGIFIVDAVTGNVLWQAGPGGAGSSCTGNPCKLAEMTYSIPADVTLVDRDFDGLIDRLYAADTGGNIWRVDLQPTGSGDMSTWQATHLAALGGSGATRRKFFFPPDVVLTKTYDVVLDITGDREHPLLPHQATNIVNRFYMIKDTKVGMSASGWTPVRDDTSSSANLAPATLFKATNTIPYDGSLNGFYVTLAGAGEKGVNAPTTVGGLVYFGTNQPIVPSSTTCQANLGTARSYSVNFLTGASSSRLFDGGGLAPSPVFGIVTVNVGGTDRQLPFLIGGGGSGADGKSGLGAQKPVIPIKNIRKRTYWYRETDRDH
ncbi:pilus assembly protein [Variovorax sp. MHTC-1]|uniref:pilus assembly protein n=1 Tax=Variovorax sp. MHTC-1 TaxID=2495593 RepID=UPI000F85D416|nr:PilC/PilY family type IV pilus protein [Variovorax sp. MHTC-1]RST52587.1 pilus assembly protein PilY [Variovorax sp. MHTC-1]